MGLHGKSFIPLIMGFGCNAVSYTHLDVYKRQAMMLTVRKVFPAAKLINDRFHVQQDVYKRQDYGSAGYRFESCRGHKKNKWYQEF